MTCDFYEVAVYSLDFAWGQNKKLCALYHLKKNREKEKNLIPSPLMPFLVMNYSYTSVIGFVMGAF